MENDFAELQGNMERVLVSGAALDVAQEVLEDMPGGKT